MQAIKQNQASKHADYGKNKTTRDIIEEQNIEFYSMR